MCARVFTCLCVYFPPPPEGTQHARSWFWAPLIVRAHYQSLCDRSGPEQRLPALRIIWALDRKLLLWHTQKARDSVKEHFCLTLRAQRWRSIQNVSFLVTACHQHEKDTQLFPRFDLESWGLTSARPVVLQLLVFIIYQCKNSASWRVAGFRDFYYYLFFSFEAKGLTLACSLSTLIETKLTTCQAMHFMTSLCVCGAHPLTARCINVMHCYHRDPCKQNFPPKLRNTQRIHLLSSQRNWIVFNVVDKQQSDIMLFLHSFLFSSQKRRDRF